MGSVKLNRDTVFTDLMEHCYKYRTESLCRFTELLAMSLISSEIGVTQNNNYLYRSMTKNDYTIHSSKIFHYARHYRQQ